MANDYFFYACQNGELDEIEKTGWRIIFLILPEWRNFILINDSLNHINLHIKEKR
jgi:hypothetical protein